MVVRLVARAGEQLNPVHLDGIMFSGIGGKNSKTAVETLRTATAVGMKRSDVVDPRAADRMLDQASAAVIDDRPNNIPFGFQMKGLSTAIGLPTAALKNLEKWSKTSG